VSFAGGSTILMTTFLGFWCIVDTRFVRNVWQFCIKTWPSNACSAKWLSNSWKKSKIFLWITLLWFGLQKSRKKPSLRSLKSEQNKFSMIMKGSCCKSFKNHRKKSCLISKNRARWKFLKTWNRCKNSTPSLRWRIITLTWISCAIITLIEANTISAFFIKLYLAKYVLKWCTQKGNAR